MTRSLLTVLAAATLLSATAPAAFAGPISRACMKSDRTAASRSVCGCIQNVADGTLSGRDQRMAARLIKDPDRAEKMRMADGDKAFWKRYRAFGTNAERSCS